MTTNQEVEPVKSKVATNDLIEKAEEEVEKRPKVLGMSVGNSQRRAVAMKVGLVQAQVTTILQEMSFVKELKHLNLQIQQLNQILKVNLVLNVLQLLPTLKRCLMIDHPFLSHLLFLYF